nr:class I SAM-dependent methyltransferase [Thiocapsa sp. KS1]
MRHSRQRKLEQFYSEYSGGPVLDVGVSGRARIEGENLFLQTFRGRDADYTGLGVEDLSDLRALYPRKTFVTYPGGKFPFENRAFDWAFSNAVIEHVGDDAAQLMFLNEMMRVSRNVYFTTPNKYFPVESHTNAFFIHWLPGDSFYAWCRRRRPYWTRQNLYLFDGSRLRRLLSKSNATEVRMENNRFLGMTMTFSVFCRGG